MWRLQSRFAWNFLSSWLHTYGKICENDPKCEKWKVYSEVFHRISCPLFRFSHFIPGWKFAQKVKGCVFFLRYYSTAHYSCTMTKKGTNGWNSCETRIVCRVICQIHERFAKNFFTKCIRLSRRFFYEFKELFLPYFQLLHTIAKTVVYYG